MKDITKNQVLGTSLSSLINDKIQVNNNMSWINIDQIEPNPNQPRKFFDQDALHELAHSIKLYGILQPILVYPIFANKYKIISGERRYRASLEIGLKKIPAIIKNMPDKDILKLSLIENLQREDITVIEEATGYKNLLDSFNYSHEDLGNMLGKSRSYISNVLRLLLLPKEIQNMLEQGDISYGHARSLIGSDNAMEIANKVKSDNLTVREVERLVRAKNSHLEKNDRNHKIKKNFDNKSIEVGDVQYISDLISKKLAMKVDLKTSAEGKGMVSVFFENFNELEKFLDRL